MTVVTVPAVLLRAHPYSESSHVLRFLTPGEGVVATVARGVRSRSSRGASPLETFARGELTVDLREGRDLQGFRDFRPGPGDPRRLGRGLLPLAAASYLAELVLAHALEEGQPQLYVRLVAAFAALEEAPLAQAPGTFLAAGWGILADFGFPPEVAHCVGCGGDLTGVTPQALARFDLESGGIRCPDCAPEGQVGGRLGPRALADLAALAAGHQPAELAGEGVHFALLDRFARIHLGMSRPFRSAAMVAAGLGGAPGEGEGSDASPERIA
jgi:DNA repair protein RecO